jgi:hypothetical protein
VAASLRNRDRVWCWGYSGLLILLTSIPYLVGFAFQGEAWSFTGFVFGVEDGNSYIAKMMLGVRGDWLFRTPYTSISQGGILAYLPYIMLGKLAAGPALHEQLVSLYHLFRSLAVTAVVFATYAFASVFLKERIWRRWVVVLATIGGGLGWLLVLLDRMPWSGSLPLDFYSPETFGFLSLYGFPHLAIARALLLLALTWYLTSQEHPRRAWWAGGALLALFFFQPISVVVAYAVLAVHLIAIGIRALRMRAWVLWKPWFFAALRAGIVALPFMLYYVVSFQTDSFLRAWTDQNRILSPAPFHYILAYGLVIVPAVVGLLRAIRAGREKELLPAAWCLALPVLAYAPHNLQRRFPEGVWVALLVLAAVGTEQGLLNSRRWRWALMLTITGLSLPTSLMLIWGGLNVARRPGPPAFRPTAEVAAFRWLRESAAPGGLVVSSYDTGNAIPAWAPLYVVIGHGPESANLTDFQERVRDVYRGIPMKPDERSFLLENGVDWLWLGPHERQLGSWRPAGESFLSLTYDQASYQIYRVQDTP